MIGASRELPLPVRRVVYQQNFAAIVIKHRADDIANAHEVCCRYRNFLGIVVCVKHSGFQRVFISRKFRQHASANDIFF